MNILFHSVSAILTSTAFTLFYRVQALPAGGLKLLESLSAFLLIRCINIRIVSLRCFRLATSPVAWWAQVDSNHRPHAYQACALTC